MTNEQREAVAFSMNMIDRGDWIWHGDEGKFVLARGNSYSSQKNEHLTDEEVLGRYKTLIDCYRAVIARSETEIAISKRYLKEAEKLLQALQE